MSSCGMTSKEKEKVIGTVFNILLLPFIFFLWIFGVKIPKKRGRRKKSWF